MGDGSECILSGSAAFALECFLTGCQVVLGMHQKWQLLTALRKVHKEDISKLQTRSSVKYLGAGIPQSEEWLCDGERSLSSISQSFASIAARNACPMSWVVMAVGLFAFSFVSTLYSSHSCFLWNFTSSSSCKQLVLSWVLWSRAETRAECPWSSCLRLMTFQVQKFIESWNHRMVWVRREF